MTVHDIRVLEPEFRRLVAGSRLGLFLAQAGHEIGDLCHVREWGPYSHEDLMALAEQAQLGDERAGQLLRERQADPDSGEYTGHELLCEITDVVQHKGGETGVLAGYVFVALSRRLQRYRAGEPWEVLLEQEPWRR